MSRFRTRRLVALSPKQRKFVAEYLKDGNGTQAAIRAGYSAKTARFQASDLLTKPNIAEAIQEGLKRSEDSAIADRKERQSFWTATLRDVAGEMGDRLKASELLGRSQKDFTDKFEVKLDGSFAEQLKKARERAQRR